MLSERHDAITVDASELQRAIRDVTFAIFATNAPERKYAYQGAFMALQLIHQGGIAGDEFMEELNKLAHFEDWSD